MKSKLRGIYAITDSQLLSGDRLLPAVEASLKGGAAVIQYRDKGQDQQRRIDEATALNQLCQRYQVPLIINDDVDLAAQVGAAGVHIGKEDGEYQVARDRLGSEAIIGISCYNSLDQALTAQRAGADYIAFGRFFPSSIKPDAIHASPELISAAKEKIHLPIVAIGGINAQNGGILIQQGADMLAVISTIFADPNPQVATQKLTQLFS